MSKTINPIRFHFLSPCTLSARGSLKAFILSMFRKEKQPVETVDLVFCDDKYLLGLNRQFLQHDYYTDILSFPFSRKGEPLVGEIYISIDRVRENASNGDHTFKQEIHRVIFHGILHFCGYSDKSTADIQVMRAMEDKNLKAYFKPNRPEAGGRKK